MTEQHTFPQEVLDKIEEARRTGATSLELANHGLTSLPDSLEILVNLTHLDLSENQLKTLPQSISKLRTLTHLILRRNQLKTVDQNIFKLSNLVHLDLQGNHLKKLSQSISKLGKLTYLNLRGNELVSLPNSIINLENLKRLNISGNWMGNQMETFLENIGKLSDLTHLDLSASQLRNLPESIGELSNLESLNLSGNPLICLPVSLTQLINLSVLDLSDNYMRELPKRVGKLTNLRKLNLRANQLESLPESIGNLTKLINLNLRSNQLYNLPAQISKLVQLKQLYLDGNPMASLPECVLELDNLKILYISQNDLVSLPKSIGKLVSLTHLNIEANLLESLPESIGNLENLTHLDLGGNKLNSLPKSISNLSNLTDLNLASNQFSILLESVLRIPNLIKLDLEDNPMITPPPEIANEGIEAIRNYFEELSNDSVKLYEVKMLLIGQGVVGKTSLKHKLIDPTFDIQAIQEDDRTHGIEIDQWKIECELENESKDITLNIWDFGGQEIYHATHQFFLTKRSLYILLGDTTRQDNQFKYWLNVVNLLGMDAPVLVVMNKVDLQHAQLNQAEYKDSFPQIENFHNISILKGNGMEDLQRQIKESIAKLPHLGDRIPKHWLDVRERLEADGRNFIDYDDYVDICEEFDMDEERAAFLIDYLHDLGAVLHFKHNRILRNYVILEPEWGTQAIYKVLDPKIAPDFMKENLGHFVFEDLQQIWKERKVYKGMARDILLELMLTFELCFKLHDTQTYIVPELLPENPPATANFAPFKSEEKRLRFEYRYDFMPKGLMTRFICRIHKLIKERSFWKSGVILQFEGSQGYINHQFLQRKISIQLVGNDNKELLAIIRSHFDHIHDSLNNLKVDEMIPCICNECRENPDPHFFAYDKLKLFLKKNRQTIVCDKSVEDVDIRILLEGVQYHLNTIKIKDLLAANQLDDVFVELRKAQIDLNTIIMIERDWNDINNRKRKGVIEDGKYTLAANRISDRILDMMDMSGG